MKNKLKHKIKYCIANYHNRYDRNFVKKMWGDSQFVPFGKTMRKEPFDEFDYWRSSQKHIRKYINKWLMKRINEPADKIFGDYLKLGWRNTYEANMLWNEVIKKKENLKYNCWNYWHGLYIDSENFIRYKI